MIRDYLCVPAGAFGNERDFSVATLISTSVRGASMRDETLRRDTCNSLWAREPLLASALDSEW
jgi:hypothetical protein